MNEDALLQASRGLQAPHGLQMDLPGGFHEPCIGVISK